MENQSLRKNKYYKKDLEYLFAILPYDVIVKVKMVNHRNGKVIEDWNIVVLFSL